jgi:MFS family permease
MYFIQGIGEPTEGLIAQPVRSLLKGWGQDAAQIAAFSGLLALPWSLKPLYGVLSDFVPMAGYRRKGYLLLTSAATAFGLALLYALDLPSGAVALLLLLLLLPTIGVSFSDVVVDALMVEKGQPLGMTGVLQSVQWTAIYAGTIVTGVLGGYLAQTQQQQLGFLLCALCAGVMLLMAFFLVDERRYEHPARDLRSATSQVAKVARSPVVLAAAGFLFLWSFNPFNTAVLYVYMTRDMGMSEQFYGNTISVLSMAAIVASVAYGLYCRRVRFRLLIHTSIITGILATVAYWWMVDEVSAILVTVLVGFTYMTANLIQFDLAARVCPPEVAGTVFAILMALSNLATSLSTSLGGYLYELGLGLWGPRLAFNALVAMGAAATACCWFLVPVLSRYGTAVEQARP